MIWTLRSRLTLVYTGVFAGLLAATAAASYAVLTYQLDADVTETLTERTRGLHGYLRFADGAPVLAYDANDAAEAAFVDEATRYYQVFDASSGRLLAQSDALRPLGLEFTQEELRAFAERPVALDIRTDYGRLRLSNSLFTPSGGGKYVVQVGVSLAPMDRVLHRFLVLLVVSLPTGLVVALLVGHRIAGLALAPLTQLSHATRNIDISDLERRLPVRGARDELDAVATAFNDTLARLEHAVGNMRQFSAALAHELRTPLAALRAEIETALSQPDNSEDLGRRLASQLEEIDKLKSLIDQVLMLARAEAGQIKLRAGPVDLGALAFSLVDQLEAVAQAKQIDLRCQSGTAVQVRGDSDWLRRLVLNLLDNAIKFTPSGGAVAVRVADDGSWATLAVQDSGPGIEPEAVPHIFERFFRADPARSPAVGGTGLGLSLARWIAERHDGRIDVDTAPGRGSTFTLRLPSLRRH